MGVAATVFFLMESMAVSNHWKTSMNVGALVTLVAAVHYFYMREFWVIIHSSPILYRYIDWSITVPLQVIEFYLTLSAVKPDIGGGMFWRLLLGTVAMLSFGYLGETFTMDPLTAFVLGLSGWFFILFEIFAGAGGAAAREEGMSEYVASSFGTMRFIVTMKRMVPNEEATYSLIPSSRAAAPPAPAKISNKMKNHPDKPSAKAVKGSMVKVSPR